MSTFDAGAIEATLRLDRSPFQRDVKWFETEAARLERKGIHVDLNLDNVEKVVAAREAIGKDVTVNVDVDSGAAESNLAAVETEKEIVGKDVTINVDADTGAAEAKLGFLQSQLLASHSASGALIGSLVALAPAAVPVLAVTAGAVGGLGTALAGAAGGAGILAAGIIGNVKALTTANKGIAAAQKALNNATTNKARAKALKQLQEANAQMSPAMRQGQRALASLQQQWLAFTHATSKDAFGLISRGLRIANSLLRQAVPLFHVFAGVVSDALGGIARWVNSPAFARFLDFFRTTGAMAMRGFLTIAGNLGRMFVSLFQAFAPLATYFVRGTERMTAAWARWARGLARSHGFQDFIKYVKDNGPLVFDFIRNLFGAVMNILKSLAPLGTALLRGLNSVLAFISAMDPKLLGDILTAVLGIVGAFTALTLVMAAVSAISGLGLVGGIILGIVALGAALVVAYRNSETFRDIVTKVFDAVKGAAMATVHWFTGPFVGFFTGIGRWFAGPFAGFFVTGWHAVTGAFQTAGSFVMGIWRQIVRGANTMWRGVETVWGGLKAAWRAVAGFIRSIWDGWINPIFQLFRAVASRVFGALWRGYMGMLKAEWRVASAVVRAIWNGVIHPVFNAFAGVVRWLVNSVAIPLWHVLQGAWRGAGSVLRWVWNNVIHPMFNGMAGAVRWLVNSVARPLWGTMRSLWSGLGSAMKSIYNHTIKPVIDFFASHIKDVRGAFRWTVDGIRSIWNELKNIAKMPVKFVIGTVLNHGLIAGFNKLAGVFGTTPMKTIPMPFAKGGVLPGYTPGRDVHRFYSPTGGLLDLSGGEAIMRPEFTKLVGGEKGVKRLNESAKQGRLAMAGGGVVDWLGNAFNTVKGGLGAAVNWGKNLLNAVNPVGAIRRVVGGLLNRVGGTGFADLVKAGGRKLLTEAIKWATGRFFGGGGGPVPTGPAVGRWEPLLRRALAMNGLPGTAAYIGAWLRQIATESGGNPAIRQQITDVNSFNGSGGAMGLLQTIPPTFNAYAFPGHGNIFNGFDNMLAAIHYAKARYGAAGMLGVIGHGHGYADGGVIPTWDVGGTAQPGYNVFYNGTGKTEPLAPVDRLERQNDRLATLLEKVLAELRRDRRMVLTPDGEAEFEAVITNTAKGLNRKTTQQAWIGRKGGGN